MCTRWMQERGEAPLTIETQPGVESRMYCSYPAMTVDSETFYSATFELEKGGEFKVELYAKEAPRTVNRLRFPGSGRQRTAESEMDDETSDDLSRDFDIDEV